MSRGATLPVTLFLMLTALAPALAGCRGDVPDEPTVSGPGAGIPMGAVGAVGVSFDAPTARPEATPPSKGKGKHGKPRVGIEPADPLPPDPFATPPSGDDDEPTPRPPPRGKGPPRGPKTHSPSETTL